jgi:hypothetical protein
MNDKIEKMIDKIIEAQGDSFLHPWIVGKYDYNDWVENLKDKHDSTMTIVNIEPFNPEGKNIAIMGGDSTSAGSRVYIKRDTFNYGYVWIANGNPCQVIAHVPESIEMLKKYNVSKSRLYFFD